MKSLFTSWGCWWLVHPQGVIYRIPYRTIPQPLQLQSIKKTMRMINCSLISDTSKVKHRIYINAAKTKQITDANGCVCESVCWQGHGNLDLFNSGTLNPYSPVWTTSRLGFLNIWLEACVALVPLKNFQKRAAIGFLRELCLIQDLVKVIRCILASVLSICTRLIVKNRYFTT